MDITLLEPGRIEPNLFLWVTGVVLVVVGIGATRKTRSNWAGGESAERLRAVFAPTGEPLASALASAGPLAGPAAVVFGLIGLVLMAREVTSGAVQDVLGVIGSALVLPTMLGVVLTLTIIFFGRPKLLIPPHLRNHHGLVGEVIRSVLTSIGRDHRRGR